MATSARLIEAIESEGGEIPLNPADAAIIVSTTSTLLSEEASWPNKLIVTNQELEEAIKRNPLVLMPGCIDEGKSRGLPYKELRSAWTKLYKHDTSSINEGISDLSSLVSSREDATDHLLFEVGVNPADGSIIRGNRFTRGIDGGEYLILALLGTLSCAQLGTRGAHLRNAVRRLKITCTGIPTIRGFTNLRLLDITLSKLTRESSGDLGSNIKDCFGELGSLEYFRLSGFDCKHVLTLDGLKAPLLSMINVGECGLQSIEALHGNTLLEHVVLSGNPLLRDISPLVASASSIKTLDISGTGIIDLSVLEPFRSLDSLSIGACIDSKSLKPDKCSALLTDLRDMKGLLPNLKILQIADLSELVHLEDISHLSELKELHISRCPRLANLDALTSLCCLEVISIEECTSVTTLEALSSLPKLTSIVIKGSPSLEDVSFIEKLENLRSIAIHRCASLVQLPRFWPPLIENIVIRHAPIRELGRLPGSLRGKLDLYGCKHLKSLTGIERCKRLKVIDISPKVADLRAASGLCNLWIQMDVCTLKTISSLLAKKLSMISECRLRLYNSAATDLNPMYIDVSSLSVVTGLRCLDLSGLFAFSVNWIRSLNRLEELKVMPRSYLSSELGGCTFLGKNKIDKLRLSIEAKMS